MMAVTPLFPQLRPRLGPTLTMAFAVKTLTDAANHIDKPTISFASRKVPKKNTKEEQLKKRNRLQNLVTNDPST